MQKVVLDHVSKFFGTVRAVDDVHLTIEGGELFTLLGPSGCGKTTLLRAIAGFYQQDKGDIYFGERLINDVPTHERNIGMVFQNYAVFPHMSVFDNVAYGLHARKVPKKEIEHRVMEALDMVELGDLRDRAPSDMSGGQQQRIALARAIVIRPALLLMDEPLSNLDAKLRVKMRSDIRRMQKDLNITTIYVTHDQEEALAISDRIAVFNRGQIQQVATPFELYTHPSNQFVASFIGESNFFPCTLTTSGQATGTAAIDVLGIRLTGPFTGSYDGPAVFSIRPEKLGITTEPRGAHDVAGTVETATYLGNNIVYSVRVNTGELVDVLHHVSDPRSLLAEKQSVYVHVQSEHGVLFNSDGSQVIGRG